MTNTERKAMTNTEKMMAVLELRAAREAYAQTRAELGEINRKIAHWLYYVNQPLGEFYHTDYQTKRRAIFGELNRTRARLKRAVHEVEAFVRRPQAKTETSLYAVGDAHPSCLSGAEFVGLAAV